MANPASLHDEAAEKERQADALKSEAASLKSEARRVEAEMLSEADALDRQARSVAANDDDQDAAADLSRQADETRREAGGGSVW